MSALQYPFETPPPPGEVLWVADGVGWLRMPLPMALDHINLYLLEDDDGWWIVDTGIRGEETQRLWLQIIEQALGGKPVKAVLVTHMHPDHIGQAGWLCDRFRVPLYMSFGEYFNARTFATMDLGTTRDGETDGDGMAWTTRRYFRNAGLDDAHLERVKMGRGGFSSVVEPIPGSYVRLREGDQLRIGKRRWQVAIGRGHSPEHVCLFCEDDPLLVAGDQIIPRITSNVSVMPTEPEADPLADWLASLDYFQDLLPADTLVLPAHNTPFYGVQARLRALLDHHQDHLAAIESACLAPRTALDLLPVLFERPLDGPVLNMALGECVAHVNYLVRRGHLRRELHDDVHYYQATDPSRAGPELGRKHHRDPGPMEI